MASLFKVKALYEFEAKEDDDLGFPGGQVIDVTDEVDDNWLEGRYTDASGNSQSGIFPREFVEKYEPEVPMRPTRPTRTKQEPAPIAAPVPEPPVTAQAEDIEEEDGPPVSAVTKPQPPPVEIPPASSKPEEVRSPPSATSQQPAVPARVEPPPAPKPASAEPAAAGGKKPPPIAAKSNAFRDRIAAFNQGAAPPVAPMVPGGPKPQSNTFIKKPFVAPPPMANSYVPPPKHEPVHKPYLREEDPEIKRRQEEDRAAAEAAGLTGDTSTEQQGEGEDAPKPMTLKERMALLQQQQLEQAQRRAEGGHKKEKKQPPVKKPSESSEHAGDLETVRDANVGGAETAEKQSLDVSRERPRVPSTQRKSSEPLSPVPVAIESELVSDGNDADQSAAGETTEDDAGTIGPEDSDEKHAPPPPPRAAAAPKREADLPEEGDSTEEGEDEEDSMDEETRRRMELRERMAKMSGGMGMAGMFGPPGGMPMPGGAAPKKRKEKKTSEDAAPSSPPAVQQRMPVIPVPGMERVQSPESDTTQQADRVMSGGRSEEDEQPLPSTRKSTTEERGAPPPVPKDSRLPQERGAPPPVPTAGQPPASRSVPQPPPLTTPLSPGPGSESDDEMSVRHLKSPGAADAPGSDVDTPGPLPIRTASVSGAPPVPGTAGAQDNRRTSYFGSESQSATSDRRASRAPPPVPGSPLASPRPPPPPPPVTRTVTDVQAGDEARGESDYEGDYDTDIASSAKHKDALKAGQSHVREPSLDDSFAAEGAPTGALPLTSSAAAPRAVPPPPPNQAPSRSRQSMDAPRAPPPVPPTSSRPPGAANQDIEYDPYRYESSTRAPPPPLPVTVPAAAPPIPPREPERQESSADEELYSTTPPRKSVEAPPRPVPAPPPTETAPPAPEGRKSLGIDRQATLRRSMDQPRPSMDNGHIAADLDLAENTTWWTASSPLPPVLQSRNGIDVLSECEESTSSKRGGRTMVTKEIYLLFIDYSQTIISVQFDANNPAEAQLSQKHLPPPAKLRQDQLETYWQRFGRNIAETANSLGHSKKDSIIGNGSPPALPAELIKANAQALQPVGTRSYGALVYANLANASTQQYDEIRPGDIVTLRNARFEGTHGAMKHKYKEEYGPQHVAIVEEWDGTRRAIRAWEQGREKKKVRSEKFRLGDLRSGEVKVWRVVGRDWVEWETSQ